MTPLGERLPWDTAFWGFTIARLRDGVLRSHNADEVASWCLVEGVRCAYLLVDDGDRVSRRRADAGPFLFVDTRVTLVRRLGAVPSAAAAAATGVREGRLEDLPALKDIARTSHRLGRFHADPSLPSARCDALYETWIDQSVRGYADVVLVAQLGDEVVGYVTGHRRAGAGAQIGLFAVAASARGRGLGGALVEAAVAWAIRRGASAIEVVTQGRNQAARRLYDRHGFETARSEHWYHYWCPAADG